MARTNPKIDRLAQIPLFSRADAKALDELASAADEVSTAAGTTLITEGSQHNDLFVIVDGEVAVTVGDIEVSRLGAGEILGELAMFERMPASATVTAATDVSLLVIPFNRTDQLLDGNPSLTKAIAAQLAHRLRLTDEKLRG